MTYQQSTFAEGPSGHRETRLSACLLGDFRMRLAGADVRPRARKTAALLAYLASTESHSATRAKLADLLWSDRGDEQARNSLRQAIAELRGSPVVSSGAVVVTRDMVGYASHAVVTDIERIADAAARRDGPELASLLAKIDGAFLDDLDGVSPLFDEWLYGERVRQREFLYAVVLAAIPEMAQEATAADVQRILTALERIDPLNETVVRLRLRVDHAAGDAASIHRRFRRLTDDLSRELNVRPSHETRELFEHLLGSPPPVRQAAAIDARPALRTPPVVMVTPFSTDGRAESVGIATVCTEDIRIALAQNQDLRVLMLDAVETERAQAVMGDAVAAFVLSGSVRAHGDRATVNIQLGNVASGLLTWSEQIRLQGHPADLIDQIVARAAGAVGPAIEHDLAITLPVRSAASDTPPDAVLLYARGRHIVREARTLAAVREGADLLEQAALLDPRHVGARLRLGQLYNTDFHFLLAGHDVAAHRERAFALAGEAAALEPGNIRVQLRLAWCHLRRGEWDLAARRFHTAMAAMPHDADAMNECGFGLAHVGELDLAETLMQRAFQLNPFAPAEYHADHAVLLALAGDARSAEEHFEVCGEWRLLYQAVRLGNLGRLDPDSARLRALQRRFVEAFLAIWQPGRAPTLEDVTDWVGYTLCFRRPEHRGLALDGVEQAWLRHAPAVLGKSM